MNKSLEIGLRLPSNFFCCSISMKIHFTDDDHSDDDDVVIDFSKNDMGGVFSLFTTFIFQRQSLIMMMLMVQW